MVTIKIGAIHGDNKNLVTFTVKKNLVTFMVTIKSFWSLQLIVSNFSSALSRCLKIWASHCLLSCTLFQFTPLNPV